MNNVIVDEPARHPQQPISPRPVANGALAAVTGAMAALGLILLRDYLDDTVHGALELEQATGLSSLGAIARLEIGGPQEALVTARTPRAPAAEAYRQLRTNLMYSLVGDELASILVTSPGTGEGKTTTAANLAVALAQAGQRVILVDADLRRPTVHHLFQLRNGEGLSTLFMRPPADAARLQHTGINGLRALTAGPLPPNPAELLGSKRMQQIAAWLQKQADYVIFDSPPLLAVTDAAVLSRLAHTTLLVVQAGQTTMPATFAAIEQLLTVEARVSGAVLNGIPHHHGYDYYYYGNHRYGDQAATIPGENGKQPPRRRAQNGAAAPPLHAQPPAATPKTVAQRPPFL